MSENYGWGAERGNRVKPTKALLRTSEVAAWLGVSRATIYRWVKSGSFPPYKTERFFSTEDVRLWLGDKRESQTQSE